MKRIRILLVGLLLLLMVLGCATAEESVVDGFIVRPAEEGVCIVSTVEDPVGPLIIPMKLGENTVVGYMPSLIRDTTDMLIIPRDCQLFSSEDDAPDHKLVFKTITYTDFKGLTPSELDLLPDIQKGEYALTDFYITTIARNGAYEYNRSESDLLTTDELPGDLFGVKTYNIINPAYIANQEGDWIFSVDGETDDARIRILYYLGTPEATLVVPDNLKGISVGAVALTAIPEETETIYFPETAYYMSSGETNTERSFLEIRYMTYKRALQWDRNWVEKHSEFTDGSLMLYNIKQAYVSGSDVNRENLREYFPADSLLPEINGKPLVKSFVNSDLYFTTENWIYTIQEYEEPCVFLLDYTGVPEKIMVLPETVAEMRVRECMISAIPAEAEVVYCQEPDFSFRTKHQYGSVDVERRFVTIACYPYEKAVKSSPYLLEENDRFTEGTCLAESIGIRTCEGSDMRSEGYNGIYPAEELLKEVNGRPLISQRIQSSLGITSGDYVYNLTREGEVRIISAPMSDREGMIFIPVTLDGFRVRGVHGKYIPENVTEIMMPQDRQLDYSGDLNHRVVVYKYYDYDMIQEKGYDYSPFTELQPGELLLSGTVYCYENGKSEKLVQDYYTYPVSVNGTRILSRIREDNVQIYTSGLYTYYKLNPEEISICGFSDKEARKVEVPDQLDGLTVVSINNLSDNQIFNVSDATEIILPSTLRILGNRAIYSSKLKTLTLPEGLTELGDSAISVYSLRDLTLPSTLRTIGANAISSQVQNLVIPDGVTTIKEGAFRSCYYLRSLTLPAGLTEIPANMCTDLTRLQSITIPANVISIGEGAFSGCKKLGSVKFAGTSLRSIGESAFVGCESLGSLKLPENVEEIGYQAFYGCKKIKEITFPATMKRIAGMAFGGCSALGKVTVGAGVEEIDSTSFKDCAKNMTVLAPEGSYAIRWAESNGYKTKVTK